MIKSGRAVPKKHCGFIHSVDVLLLNQHLNGTDELQSVKTVDLIINTF